MVGKRPSSIQQERGGGGGGGARGTEIRRPQDKAGKRPVTEAERKAAFYRKIVEKDCDYLFLAEEDFPCYPGGPAAAMAMNDTIRYIVKEFKAYAARRAGEFEAMG